MQRYFEINMSGCSVRCKLYYTDLKDIGKVIVFGSGFGGHKDNKAAEKFAERCLTKYKRTAMITFDWPCHGDDVRKKLSLSDCETYIRLVLEHIGEKYPQAEKYCYATSFGGYLMLGYIAKNGNPFKKIALRCPAVPMYDVLTASIMQGDDLIKLQKGKDVPVGFDRKINVSAAFLEELKANDIRGIEFFDWAEDILILHGTADEVVPCETSGEFAENNVIEFVPIEGADHRFQNPARMEEAIKRMTEFFFA